MVQSDATYTIEKKWKDVKGKLHHIGKVQMSAAYKTGGDILSLGNFFRVVEQIDPIPLEDSGGYVPQITDTNFNDPDATNSILVMMFYGNWAAGADGPLIQVAEASYSGVYFRVHITGLAR